MESPIHKHLLIWSGIIYLSNNDNNNAVVWLKRVVNYFTYLLFPPDQISFWIGIGKYTRSHDVKMASTIGKVSSVFRSGLFDGKVAIVTGGGTGIGLAITQELLYLGKV